MPKAAAAPKTQSSTPFSSRILVVIERDMTTKTPKVIWQHELPVIEAVFGEGAITVVDSKEMDEGYSAKTSPSLLVHNKKQDQILPPSETAGLGFLFIGDADTEYERLAAVYGMDPEESISQVEKAYGRKNEGRLRRMLTLPTIADLPERQLRSVLIDHGISLPEDDSGKELPIDHAGLLAVAEKANFEIE